MDLKHPINCCGGLDFSGQDPRSVGSYKMSDIVYGRTQPTIITNERGMATQGYLIEVRFPEFDEIHDLRVASLDPKVVKAAGEKLYKQRAAIEALNKSEKA